MEEIKKITISALANAPISKIWEIWNSPNDIMVWNTADPSWHCPSSENNLKIGGKFKHLMEAKDGSFGFYFEGIYDKVDLHKEIAYTMGDGRKAITYFSEKNGKTTIETTFDAETENNLELQKQGWQSILNNFVKHVESKN